MLGKVGKKKSEETEKVKLNYLFGLDNNSLVR